jgi:acetolactate synthase-1/2/3 large subunit
VFEFTLNDVPEEVLSGFHAGPAKAQERPLEPRTRRWLAVAAPLSLNHPDCADFLVSKAIKHVFAISGGASLHLIHSIADNGSIDYICNHHEQASAMCADAYSRITGNIGVVVATSGPDATNLITGLCCSYYDSVPVLAITGQVSTTRMVGETGVRQIGFQETPIVEICKPITKYAVQITDPNMIVYEL